MTLYSEVRGSGPEVILVHGWGTHGGVFHDLANRLAAHYRVVVPDLPGFGLSPCERPECDASDMARRFSELLEGPAVWIGWSMGALVAIAAAMLGFANRIVLIGATPRFVAAPDWPYGMPEDRFQAFVRDVEMEPQAALNRFAGFQVSDLRRDRRLLAELRRIAGSRDEPDPAALRAGLRLLAEEDVRACLPEIHVPALVVHGSDDRLADPEAGRFLASGLRARFRLMPDTGHVPWLVRPEEFSEVVNEFLAS